MYCDTFGLLVFCKSKPIIRESLRNIMTVHRTRADKFELLDFVIEESISKKDRKMKAMYMLIFSDDEIIGLSRIMYNKKKSEGIISTVHTNEKYRGKKICQVNIKKLVKLTNKKFKIKNFFLSVDVNNMPAIKCYEKCGFIIYDTLSNDLGNYHKMQNIIDIIK